MAHIYDMSWTIFIELNTVILETIGKRSLLVNHRA